MNKIIGKLKLRRKTVLISAVVLIGYIVRLLYYIKYPVFIRDAYTYKTIIEQWIKSNTFPDYTTMPPMGLYILRIPAVLFNYDIIKGGIIVNVLIGLCMIAILMVTVYEIIPSNTVMVLSGLLFATHPTPVHFSCQLMRDNSYLFFCMTTILMLLLYIKRDKCFYLVFASMFSCFAYLCRHEGLEMFPICCAVFLLTPNTIPQKISRVFAYSFLFVIFFFLTLMIMGIPVTYGEAYWRKLCSFNTLVE